MYSRQQASEIRQEFWTIFGQYLSPQLSADGLKINWINYKTGVPGVSFKMDADTRTATIAIILSQPDPDVRELYFEQFLQLKTMLHPHLDEQWIWEPIATDESGRAISRIYKKMTGVNVMDKNDWPAIISFFKPRIISLDEFWSTAKYTFDDLRF
ncbi:MAG: DUF4268 domain-containing protein [Sphingobacteriales bacterium]|nr:MAG: DUF4268 domain-containing protein [Sphingobacteriales bacterium]